ncbi:MAG: FAD:protein FMN transferase, partial [Gammaproteobacteria bacterium]|nr:FAD:protein FMN transferase [Gammaproteobacteria bacterium]
ISNGLFNPAMGKLIAAWGFHNKSTPDYSVINNIQSNIPGMHDLVIKNNLAYSLNSQLKLDFGAIAKGLAVEQIANLVKAQNFKHFIINAGGDIFAQGKKNQHNWKIAIESPFSDDIIGKLEITSPSSIFTSGNYRRFYLDQNNIRRHHIINPITGEPSENISAVTILHRDPMLADIAATTLMLTPTDSIKKMAQQLKIQDFMVITEQQTVLISKSLNKKITWKPDLDLNIQII